HFRGFKHTWTTSSDQGRLTHTHTPRHTHTPTHTQTQTQTHTHTQTWTHLPKAEHQTHTHTHTNTNTHTHTQTHTLTSYWTSLQIRLSQQSNMKTAQSLNSQWREPIRLLYFQNVISFCHASN